MCYGLMYIHGQGTAIDRNLSLPPEEAGVTPTEMYESIRARWYMPETEKSRNERKSGGRE